MDVSSILTEELFLFLIYDVIHRHRRLLKSFRFLISWPLDSQIFNLNVLLLDSSRELFDFFFDFRILAS